jgi:hypothetical protein
MSQACLGQWVKWLSLAEFWYNTRHHCTLWKSPFEVSYGYKFKNFGMQNIAKQAPGTVQDLENLAERERRYAETHPVELVASTTTYEESGGQKKVEMQFSVGNQVYLKLQPYIQTSIAK